MATGGMSQVKVARRPASGLKALEGIEMAEQIRRVLVWSGWLRVAHAALALATLLLVSTGWLVANAPSVAVAAADAHYLGAGILVFALALRLFLGVFGSGAERFEHMLPGTAELAAIRDSALFYLSLGRAPMPNWFAHNPLWKLLYLVLLVVLALQAVVGWLMPDTPLVWRFYLPHVHATLATLITLFVGAHLYSVILQDYRGSTADISAMINGHRYFTIERDGLVKPDLPQVAVRIDSLTPPSSKRDD